MEKKGRNGRGKASGKRDGQKMEMNKGKGRKRGEREERRGKERQPERERDWVLASLPSLPTALLRPRLLPSAFVCLCALPPPSQRCVR